MKKTVLLFIVIILASASMDSLAQGKRKTRKLLWNSANNYEAVCVGTGVDGTKLIKAFGYDKKAELAAVKAEKNAIAACIFKGVAGTDQIPPLIPADKPDVATEYEEFFNNFFQTGGDYLRYIGVSTDTPGGSDRVKMDKGYKVGVTVSVMYDNLRKYLEEKGIIDKLGGQLKNAKKPTVMVVPSDAWCIDNGFVMTFDNQGTLVTLPDYKKALQSDQDLLLVIGKINTMMAERGFPLKDLESTIKSIEQESAEISMMSSKTSGAEITESPIDIIKRTAKADIIMQITYDVNKQGPKNSITFNLRGLDAYTNKQVAGAQGTGKPSYTAQIPLLLEEAVLQYIDPFNKQLQMYFDDIVKNGREISMQVRIWDSSPVDLEEEYDYDGESGELNIFIEDWMADNTVNGVYNLSDMSENVLKFEQVRIPVFYMRKGKERAMDAKRFGDQLRKFLKKAPFELESKNYQRGLGEVWIIVGEK